MQLRTSVLPCRCRKGELSQGPCLYKVLSSSLLLPHSFKPCGDATVQ